MSELDPTTRALLAASRSADNPSDEQLSRVERSLMAKIAIGAGASVSIGAATTKAAGATLGLKMASGVLLAGALTGGGVWLAQPKPEAVPLERSQPRARPMPVTSAPVVATPEPVVEPLVKPSAPATVNSEDPMKPGSAVKAESPALKLKAEAALVSEAQRALGAGRAGEALERLAQYDQRFPGGALRSEADATRVFALCQSGRTREAVAAKESFLRRYPSSPAAPRVRSACSTP
jgi:hypothetical protein